ncbi:hypothetical protein [uncultured Roseibium sp.]|uniref:hypothetical protein n=1 Tax=uncultured Roseibium sp. TaxID=1936171 RepID=UPI002623D433|nr:hypothetical protein [uncultured Roseibium sp.]
MEYNEEFNLLAKAQADQKRQLDFDDLQREMSGIDIGKIARFLSPEARELLREGKGKNGVQELSRLISAHELALMNDANYAQAYSDYRDDLDDLADKAEHGRSKAQALLDRLQSEYDTARLKAGEMPDGTLVYQDENGIARTEDGQEIGVAADLPIEWTGGETTFETIDAQREKLEQAGGAVKAWTEFEQEVLTVQDQEETRAEKMTVEEMDAIIEELNDKMPEIQQAQQADVALDAAIKPVSLDF